MRMISLCAMNAVWNCVLLVEMRAAYKWYKSGIEIWKRGYHNGLYSESCGGG